MSLEPGDTDAILPTVHIGGFDTIVATRAQLAAIMVQDCLVARQTEGAAVPKLVFSSNGQGIALAGRSTPFAEAMAAADIVHADGMPVVFASRFTRRSLPERISTTDFFHDAARAAGEKGLSFFMLGGSEDQNARVVEAINRLYPAVKIAGRHHGYFAESENAAVCEKIRDSGADVLWVALGKPRQEFWSVENRERLNGVGWIKTCGGLYGYLVGDERRAPGWMQTGGLEWLYRAAGDPTRLLWRYLTTNPYALYRILTKSGGDTR